MERDAKEAQRRMVDIKTAYEIPSNENKRSAYMSIERDVNV